MMSKENKFLIISLAILFLIVGFSKSDFKSESNSFSIYLVKDLSTQEAMGKDIDKLPLENKAVLTEKELEFYSWDQHIIYLKENVNLEKKLEGEIPIDGRPFVLFVDGKRIYLGSFWNIYSSLYYFDIPIINFNHLEEVNKNRYKILYKIGLKDPRSDKRIYDALVKLKKLD